MSKNDSTANQSKLGSFWKGVKAEFKKIIADRGTVRYRCRRASYCGH